MAGGWSAPPEHSMGAGVLVAPGAFKGTLRASEVAAAIGQGLEAAGLAPPDLCPVADGGPGTIDVLLSRLGGETAAARISDPLGRAVDVGFALLDDGSTALIEAAAASRPGSPVVSGGAPATSRRGTRGTGELIVAAVEAGAEVVLVAVGGPVVADGGAGAIATIESAGGLRGARLVVLCDVPTPYELAPARLALEQGHDCATAQRTRDRFERLAERLPRDPRSVIHSGAGGGLAGGLWAAFGAELRPGAQYVLGALDFDSRLRGARAVIAGEGHLDRSTLDGKLVAEVARRARQAGVPAHAVVGVDDLDRFDARILDLQEIVAASTRAEIVAAGVALAGRL